MSDTGSMSAAEATGKRRKVATCDYNLDNQEGELPIGGIGWFFNDGREIQVNIGQFPESIVKQAALRGIMEVVRDTYAGLGGDIDKAYNTALERVKSMQAGDWGRRSAGEGSGVGALWIEALAHLRGWLNEDGSVNFAQAREKIKAVADSDGGEAKIEAVKKSDPIKAKVAEIKARRAQEALAKAQAAAAAAGDTGLADLDAFA